MRCFYSTTRSTRFTSHVTTMQTLLLNKLLYSLYYSLYYSADAFTQQPVLLSAPPKALRQESLWQGVYVC
jgi:hypothetical protein